MSPKTAPAPRTLQEWMERHQISSRRLIEMVKTETGHSISETMLSFILRGSRRCSRWNAWAIHCVTKVPMDVLTAWPKPTDSDKASGKGQKHVA